MYNSDMKRNRTVLSSEDKLLNTQMYDFYERLGIEDGWVAEDKEENFELFTTVVRLTDSELSQSSILDVGCGTGDFCLFLEKHSVNDYIGIDLYETAVDRAQKQYPKYTFIHGDFLDYDFKRKFDFVYSSGAMTTKFKTDNYLVLQTWVKKMWDLADKGVAFNVLLEDTVHVYTDIYSKKLFFYDRKKVLEVCAKVLPKYAKIRALVTDSGTGDGSEELHVFLYR